jgi:hypothetical protein
MLTEDSPYIDLVFSLIGQSLPLDNGYIRPLAKVGAGIL